MVDVAPQVHELSPAETGNVAIDARGKLDAGETYTGTPVITEVDTSDLTIASKVVSTAELTINGEAVPAGEAIQFKVSGVVSGTYLVNWVCGTTAGQTRDGRITLVAS